jgi:hypothetical protein
VVSHLKSLGLPPAADLVSSGQPVRQESDPGLLFAFSLHGAVTIISGLRAGRKFWHIWHHDKENFIFLLDFAYFT